MATALSLGSSLSNVVSGYIVNAWGFNIGFLFLASVAALALIIFGLMMPETKGLEQRDLIASSQKISP